MADNLSIESPDFDRIRKGDFRSIEDAVKLLWYVANNEMKLRRVGDRKIEDRLSPRILLKSPTAQLDNVDTEGAGLIVYTGSTAVDVTGYRAPSEDGDILFILVTGSATIKHKDQNAGSDASNRIVASTGADINVATNKSLALVYQNTRWREMKWA